MIISTHAPRTGSDELWQITLTESAYFNPRSPHGERPTPLRRSRQTLTFQPTLPARGATGFEICEDNKKDISTHAPRTGSDSAK